MVNRPEGYTRAVFSEVGKRDGLGMFLVDADEMDVFEDFREDDDEGRLTFRTLEKSALPLHVVEWFIQEAKDDLPIEYS